MYMCVYIYNIYIMYKRQMMYALKTGLYKVYKSGEHFIGTRLEGGK